jgi:hypothetical protein
LNEAEKRFKQIAATFARYKFGSKEDHRPASLKAEGAAKLFSVLRRRGAFPLEELIVNGVAAGEDGKAISEVAAPIRSIVVAHREHS